MKGRICHGLQNKLLEAVGFFSKVYSKKTDNQITMRNKPQVETESHTFKSPKFRSVVEDAISFFSKAPIYNLPIQKPFLGSGVYSLYYKGELGVYAPLACLNKQTCVQPIYIGKAVPSGWRTGRKIESTTTDLFRRINEHARNISHTKDLKATDFQCQFIILSGAEADLIVPVEAELIRRFKPLWNSLVDGFGNHDPGKGRYQQALSEWDLLHPGRPWAKKLQKGTSNRKKVLEALNKFFEKPSAS